MRISFSRQAAFLASVNARAEKHGDETEPAGDLKIKVDMPNSGLAYFHPTLRSALFFHDSARPGDLVDKANEENPEYLPHLRFPQMVTPIKWVDEMVGGKLTIHYGVGEESWLVLEDITVGKWEIVPKDGGTVELTFSVQAHPDESQRGKLWGMIQTPLEISVEPPAEAAQASLAS